MQAAITAQQVRPALFLQIQFLTETVWLWSGFGPILPSGPSFSAAASFPYGQTFLGMGWLGQVQMVSEITDIVAQNVTLTLSAIPVELATDAIHAVRQNSLATLWLGFLDDSGILLKDPLQIFQGHLDVPSITEGADTCSLSITAENPLVDLNRAPNGRFTDVDQQIRFPGDTGFAQVQLLQDYNTVWPSPFGDSNPSPPPSFLTISPVGPIVLGPGAGSTSRQLTARVTRTTGATVDVTSLVNWSSSDTTVATVSLSGMVTYVGKGMCVVTKSWCGGAFSHIDNSALLAASVTVICTN